jgi:hypothetical protein
MILVGSFKFLRSMPQPGFTGAPLEVNTWVRSDMILISPLVRVSGSQVLSTTWERTDGAASTS